MAISTGGKDLYGGVNGKDVDGISVFEANQDSGDLKPLQHQRVDSKWACGANLSPGGKYAIVSCLDGDGAGRSFRAEADGRLTPTGSRASVPGAAYATFFPVE